MSMYSSNYGMSSYSTYHSKTEKELVKDCLSSPIIPKDERTKFYLVSTKWLDQWKKYSNFDVEGPETRTKEEIQGLHPGPVDNNDLLDADNELRKGLLEKRDFEILTEQVWFRLISVFKGGPSIAKNAVNLGSKDAPVYQIEIYMLPFRAHIVASKDFVVPDVMSGIKWSVSKNCTFGLVCGDILRTKSRPAYNFRCWVRRHKPVEINEVGTEVEVSSSAADTANEIVQSNTTVEEMDQTTEEDSASEIVGPEGILPKKRRQLTADVVEVDGEWRLFRKPEKVSVMDICVDDGGITEILIEVGPNYYTAAGTEIEWPKAAQALAWQMDLRVGDEVDCQDSKFMWLEGVIIAVNEDKSVKVHFKGWNAQYDEVIPAAKVPIKILPLYTNVKNWRANIEEDDKLDVRVEVDGKFLWVLGTVQEINVPERKVLLSYTSEDVDSASGATKNSFKSSLEDIDDDKPLSLTGSTVEANADTAPTLPPPPPKPTTIQVWRSIEGEDICDAYMHTPKKYNSYTSRGYDDIYGEKNTTGKPVAKGVVGLQNIGNTCFMNSILQCLSNTYCLTEFFVSNKYKSQINTTSVLGHKGEVAKAYAKLMKDMWCDGYTKVVPRNFKKTIGEFQPQFAGYSQQDSQEFLGFLLDGLHEDLNRIAKAPYVPKIDSNGREDTLIAKESWRRFLLRHDSELVDRVYGQIRSHVTCTNCGKESVTFDPFNSLSLPVPIKTARIAHVMVRILPLGTAPLRVAVEVDLTDTVGDLRLKVVKLLKKAGYLTNYDASKVQRLTSYANQSSAVETEPAAVIALPYSDLASDMDIDDSNKAAAVSDDDAKAAAAATITVDTDFADERVAYRERCAAIATGDSSLEPIFHVGTYYETESSKVTKTLDDKSPVGDLLRGRESAYMFQLEHPCAVKSRRVVTNSFVTYVDLVFCFVKKPVHAMQTEMDGFCYPERVNITKDTTPADLYLLADKAFRRLVLPTSDYYDNVNNRPFELHVKSLYDFRSKRKLDCNDTNPIVFGEFDAIAMLLLPEANKTTYIDTREMKLVNTVSVTADDDDVETDEIANDTNGKKGKGLTVYKCLDKFIEREQLNDSETLYCSKCKQHLAPVKKMDLWATPDVLIIHLKRFQYVPGQYFVHRDKISDLIDFPIEGLDLTTYVQGPQSPDAPPVYDLYGVSHHSGGMGGGHYTAVCKNPLDNNWYSFNDSFVSPTTAKAAVNELAYVLFYKRRQGEAKWAGIEPLETGLSDE